MAVEIVMPQAGQDLDVGTVKQWLKHQGDEVKRGEPIVEVETEKISLEIEAPADGVLRRILVGDGEEAAILSVIGVIAGADEAID
jgi:pyruvate/2-oxoglutarate dehydrogenase complex dihydrolipoamide acyltransferase (E2) component